MGKEKMDARDIPHSVVEEETKAEDSPKGKEMSYRLACKYKGAGLTHYVMRSEDSPY